MTDTKWMMLQHNPGSDGSMAGYTLRPQGVIIQEGLSEQEAALFEAVPDSVGVLREFCNDVKAVGIRDTKEDWPDLYETFRRARAVLAQLAARAAQR
jgi:hypothetical protein